MTLLFFGGITNDGGSIYNLFVSNGSFNIGAFMNRFLLIIGGAAAAATAAGFLGRSVSESYFLTPLFAGFLVNYLIDFKTVIDVVNTTGQVWLSVVTFIIMGGLAAGYSIALVQFWRGNDI